MFIVEKDKFPLPTAEKSPNLFACTRVLHPIVTASYLYLSGSFASHLLQLLNVESSLIKLGKNLLAETLHANLYKS